MGGGKRPGLDVILAEPSAFANVRDMLGGNPRKHDEVLDLYILARAIGHEPPEIIDALQQKGYDTTRVTNGKCQEVYSQDLRVAAREFKAGMQMEEAIKLNSIETRGSPNFHPDLEPPVELHMSYRAKIGIFKHKLL